MKQKGFTMISLRNISKEVLEAGEYVPILKGIDLDIQAGEFISIMGPSGSGKSTLMNILGLLDESTDGEYVFEGQKVEKMGKGFMATFRNRKIGFVFQSFMLIPRMSVKENVEVPLIYANVALKERRRRIHEALEKVGMLNKASEPVVNLSGGQKQKVAIARAIINQPDLLLADEPTGNLDQHSKEEILQIFQELNRQGKTIVLVTHDEEVANIADRRLMMKNGVWADDRLPERRAY